jgi:hypothetical protein
MIICSCLLDHTASHMPTRTCSSGSTCCCRCAPAGPPAAAGGESVVTGLLLLLSMRPASRPPSDASSNPPLLHLGVLRGEGWRGRDQEWGRKRGACSVREEGGVSVMAFCGVDSTAVLNLCVKDSPVTLWAGGQEGQ